MATRRRPALHSLRDHWHYFEAAQRLRSLDEVARTTARFARALGFETHGFAHRAAGAHGDAPGDVRIFHNHRSEFSAWYERLRTSDGPAGDVRVMQARLGLPAAAWNVRGDTSYVPTQVPSLARRVRQQLLAAGEFNMRGGLTLPGLSRRADWCFMSLATDRTQDLRDLADTLGAAVYFMHCLQVSMDRLVDRRQPVPVLRPRASARRCAGPLWARPRGRSRRSCRCPSAR